MIKKQKVIITKQEKFAIFVTLSSKFSKFCISIQFMNALFRVNIAPCLVIVIIYWVYCNRVTECFESDYINAMEKLIYFKLISRIDKEDYDDYVRNHLEYFKLEDKE